MDNTIQIHFDNLDSEDKNEQYEDFNHIIAAIEHEVKDDVIKKLAQELIELEEDPKYQKKYAKVWKNA